MENKQINEMLKEQAENWTNNEPPETEFSPIPDGDYMATLINFDIRLSKANDLMAHWVFKLVSSGRVTSCNTMLAGKYSWIAKKSLKNIGIECENLTDLPGMIPAFIGLPANITLKTNDNNNQNVYVNKTSDPVTVPKATTKPKPSDPMPEEEDDGVPW